MTDSNGRQFSLLWENMNKMQTSMEKGFSSLHERMDTFAEVKVDMATLIEKHNNLREDFNGCQTASQERAKEKRQFNTRLVLIIITAILGSGIIGTVIAKLL